jgi:putative flippase GtrA
MFHRIPRYIVVGALCAVIYNIFMVLGDAIGVHYLWSTVVAFIALVLLGYLLHCRFTFSQPMSLSGLARYAAAMALTLPLSAGGMYVLRDLLRVPMTAAAPTVTVSLFVWNYLAARWAVIARRLKPRARPLDEAAG